MSEEWRAVPGYDRYQVSNKGRVRAVKSGRVLKGGSGCYGYVQVSVRAEGESRTKRRFVHVLVVSAFIGPKPTGQEVRHLNDVKTDNRLDNLEYGTHSQNMLDRGKRQSVAKEQIKIEVRRLVSNAPWLTGAKVGNILGIPVGTAAKLLAEVRKEIASTG